MLFAEIDELRRKTGLTARAVCTRAGVSACNYSQYRKGKRDPRESTLKKLAEAVHELAALPSGEREAAE